MYRFLLRPVHFRKNPILQDTSKPECFSIKSSGFIYANANPNTTQHIRIHLFPSINRSSNAKILLEKILLENTHEPVAHAWK
jgi:hypothetical protein